MIVHEDSEKPVKIVVPKKTRLEPKSYVIVKKHVKELSNIVKNTTNKNWNDEELFDNSEKQPTMKKTRKTFKKQKKNEELQKVSKESDNISRSGTEIDPSDLNELKTVYMKCKEVMTKIETKYGHLLNLNSGEGSRRHSLKRNFYSETYEDECICKAKKKIIFDDDGRQSTVDIADKHICVNNVKNIPTTTPTHSGSVAVEYQDAELGLPDDICELREILYDPELEMTYRNKVLQKIRVIKEEYSNDIKFNKHILIEKLKSNPDDVLNFKGTNLSTIPGYS